MILNHQTEIGAFHISKKIFYESCFHLSYHLPKHFAMHFEILFDFDLIEKRGLRIQ